MIQLNQLSDEIIKSLEAYNDDVAEKIDRIVEETSKELRDELKKTSPRYKGDEPEKKKRAGKYARSWKLKRISDKKGNSVFVVHNTQYQLTHLLENGHLKRNGDRTKAIPHIKPAEDKFTEIFLKKVEEVFK